MSFRGLFIGIDRYVSPAVDELRCARRDAVALHALFSDTLGGQATLLTDADATRARIEAEFAALTNVDPDDTVVIAFSGHGSETHELISHDADLTDLSRTAIPLDLIQEWFARVPARRLIFFLDCCFSGGIGAKVLHVPVKPRDVRSTEIRLQQLAGDGRIIFTASSATEPAYEDGRFGHGFLTFYLLQALQGAEEVVSGGKISVYRLLEHVTRRVQSAALQIGRLQSPAMRGTIDGDISWPVFVPGQRYLTAFPARTSTKVTSDVASLVQAGFPQDLVEAWASAIPSLNALQLAAINEFGILDGQHLVVSAPTSSGKTMVGELAALRNILDRKRAVFLLPLKALVADKRRHFDSVYSAFGVRTVEATGETDDISPLLRGQYDIALLTYEKFAAIALSFPHVLMQAGVIVIDEAQMIADEGRGANLEFLLTLIRMRRRNGIEPQVVALSAVIGDTNGLEQWLGARLLRRTERPVPLREGILRGDGSFRYLDPTTNDECIEEGVIQRQFGKGSSQDWVIPLTRRLVGEGQQVIVFRETKGEARGCANYLAESLRLPPAADAMARMPTADPSQASADLRVALRGGVAFHNADLEREEKRVIEEEFRRPKSGLRVIAATTTLAMGVNTPASSVIVCGLMHPLEQPYSVAEYKNLVGRAGRLGYAESGTSYLLALTPREEYDLWERYVLGSPEDLISRFMEEGTDPRSLIVRVLVAARRAGGAGISNEEIVDFLEASFGAFQARRSSESWRWTRSDVLAALADLQRHRLVEASEDGTYRLTALGQLAGEGAVEVASVVSLVECLGQLRPEQISDPVLITAVQTTVELDDLLFPLNKKSTQKEPQVWAAELRRQGVPSSTLSDLHRNTSDSHQATMRAKKAAACLLFISSKPMAEIEATLTQFGGAFGGAAGPIRGVASRTCDLLPTAGHVAEILHPGLDLAERIGRLVVRLTYGVSGKVTDLAREAGAGHLRGDYQRLEKFGLVEPEAIDAADDATLLHVLDEDSEKLAIVRNAIGRVARKRAQAALAKSPILEDYVA